MKEFYTYSFFTGSRHHVLITLGELGSGATTNYAGVLKLISEKGYKMPEWTVLRSRFKEIFEEITDVPEGVVVNIPLSDKELKWWFRRGSKNKVQIPDSHPDDILFPASTLWLLEVAD